MDFDEAVSFLAQRLPEPPLVFVSYTSALGNFPLDLEHTKRFSCDEIPRFPPRKENLPPLHLLFGKTSKTPLLVLEGRYHHFEGYSKEEILFPIRLAKSLGCRKMLLVNAAGSVSDNFELGDLMLVRSHVDLDWLGQDSTKVFRDGKKEMEMNESFYDVDFLTEARRFVVEEGMDKYVKTGSYGMIQDAIPKNYSQITCWKKLGVDAIGTSLIPEVVAASRLGFKVFALSVLTDKGILDHYEHPDPLSEDISKALDPKRSFIKKLMLRFVDRFQLVKR